MKGVCTNCDCKGFREQTVRQESIQKCKRLMTLCLVYRQAHATSHPFAVRFLFFCAKLSFISPILSIFANAPYTANKIAIDN